MSENQFILSNIENRIFTIRGVQVMIDRDLADMYQVETKVLNQAVKRNMLRFPDGYRFQLTDKDVDSLRSQIVTSSGDDSLRSQIVTLKKGRGEHRKFLPYAFTEQGVAMLSAVLKSDIVIQANRNRSSVNILKSLMQLI